MNILSNTVKAVILGLTLLVTGTAYAGSLNLASLNWAYDTDGDGDTTAGIVDFDVFNYTSYAVLALTDDVDSDGLGTGDSFTNYGYLFPSSNGDTDGSLSKVYGANVDMSGTIGEGATFSSSGNTVYEVAFDAGSTQTWYKTETDSSVTELLQLTLVYGSSTVTTNSSGEIVGIGQLDLQYQITGIMQDYFYVELDGQWVDIWDILYDPTSEYYGKYDFNIYGEVATTSSLASSIGEDNEYADELNDVANAILGGENATDYIGSDISQDGKTITVSYGGLDLAVVPEPGMLSMMGLAFLGLAGFQSRRRRQKNS